MKPVLKVFIAPNCSGCGEALGVATRIEQKYADIIVVKVIDISDAQAIIPEAVFATPTFMLNDRVVSLGNPSPEEIVVWVKEATVLQAES